ncbi:hypothetical protein OEZ85_002442 [Tetradesmus obliquus]|uniref:SCP domain-containing protein n=1 Tax=Tetradesmus obliquus TaxID=3088 RepID=A0ABY8TXP1_TETOB|nr:hypothetical protein OEZ85_002442 [Tetradesmus obliquus]
MLKVHRRSLLQDAAPLAQEVGGSIQAAPALDTPAAAAAAAASAAATAAPSTGSSHVPDAPDSSIGEALPPVTASAADLAAAAAADSSAGGAAAAASDNGGAANRPRRRANILTVPGSDVRAAAAAVISAQTTQISIYKFCKYGGRVGVVGAGQNPNLPAPWNDMISLVCVPGGMVAVFWEHPNYAARRLTVTGPIDVPCFDNWQFSRITTSFQITSSNNGGGGNGGGSNGGGGNSGGSGGIDSQLLTLVNNARRQAGLKALSIDSRLNAAALAHSQDQARRQNVDHTGADCSNAGTRITRAGYRGI